MDRIEFDILIKLHRIVMDLDNKTTKIADKYNVTFRQFMVLEALYSKGDMSIGEVRDSILSTVGTISIIVNNLEKLGYIFRKPHEKDKRICILSLTEKGRKAIENIIPENNEMILNSFMSLNGEEKNLLLHTLEKLGGKYE